jgi:hypothetical protein
MVLAVISHLNKGEIDDALALFADQFSFKDHGTGLQFNAKDRLAEFFRKAPNSTRVSSFVSGQHALTEWTLQATLIEPAFAAIIVPGNVKHALRNSSTVPVTLALVTKSELYSFFRELAKPFDPHQPAATVTPKAMQQLFEVAAKYGYWLASPAENEAIGLNIM